MGNRTITTPPPFPALFDIGCIDALVLQDKHLRQLAGCTVYESTSHFDRDAPHLGKHMRVFVPIETDGLIHRNRSMRIEASIWLHPIVGATVARTSPATAFISTVECNG